MRTCQNCGAAVTARFTRVFGDRNDDVWACRNCTTIKALQKGAGARTDR